MIRQGMIVRAKIEALAGHTDSELGAIGRDERIVEAFREMFRYIEMLERKIDSVEVTANRAKRMPWPLS